MSKLAELTEAAGQKWMDYWISGPLKTRWDAIPLQNDDNAPSFSLPDQTGNMVNLNSFWKDKPALIIFWRHFGCSCGVDRAGRLKNEFQDYLDANANIVIIGQGEPERSTAYAQKYDLPDVAILSDPSYQVFHAYGLLDGKESQILFDAPEEYLDRSIELGKSFVQSRKAEDRPLVDNPYLLPGEFVIDTAGKVVLAYRYNYCEDYPDHRVHLAAIREAHKNVK